MPPGGGTVREIIRVRLHERPANPLLEIAIPLQLTPRYFARAQNVSTEGLRFRLVDAKGEVRKQMPVIAESPQSTLGAALARAGSSCAWESATSRRPCRHPLLPFVLRFWED